MKRAAGWVNHTWRHHNPFRSWYKFGQFALGGLSILGGALFAYVGYSATVELLATSPWSLGITLLGVPGTLGAAVYGLVLMGAGVHFLGRAFRDD